jgi:hypothetical protein
VNNPLASLLDMSAFGPASREESPPRRRIGELAATTAPGPARARSLFSDSPSTRLRLNLPKAEQHSLVDATSTAAAAALSGGSSGGASSAIKALAVASTLGTSVSDGAQYGFGGRSLNFGRSAFAPTAATNNVASSILAPGRSSGLAASFLFGQGLANGNVVPGSPIFSADSFASPALSAATTAVGSPSLQSPMARFNLHSPARSTASTFTYTDKPFIKNAAEYEKAFLSAQENIFIPLADSQMEIEAGSVKLLDEGHFSKVYSAETVCGNKWVLRFYKDIQMKKPKPGECPDVKKTVVTPSKKFRYLGNQFIVYAKLKTRTLTEDRLVAFPQFDALLQKAQQDPALLAQIRSLAAETKDNHNTHRSEFAAEHFTEGFLIAEYVTTNKQRPGNLTDEALQALILAYEALQVSADFHPGNWSRDGRMFDLYEDDYDPLHAKGTVTELRGSPLEMSASAKAAIQNDPAFTELTEWGHALNLPAAHSCC